MLDRRYASVLLLGTLSCAALGSAPARAPDPRARCEEGVANACSSVASTLRSEKHDLQGALVYDKKACDLHRLASCSSYADYSNTPGATAAERMAVLRYLDAAVRDPEADGFPTYAYYIGLSFVTPARDKKELDWSLLRADERPIVRDILLLACEADFFPACEVLVDKFGANTGEAVDGKTITIDMDKRRAGNTVRLAALKEARENRRAEQRERRRERQEEQRDEDARDTANRQRLVAGLAQVAQSAGHPSSAGATLPPTAKASPGGGSGGNSEGAGIVATPVMPYLEFRCLDCAGVPADPSVPEQAKRYCQAIDFINAALVKYNAALQDPSTTPAQAAEYRKNAPARRLEAERYCGDVRRLKSSAPVFKR